MSVRRILVEKSVLYLGKWDVNRVNEDVVRLIDIDSLGKKGKKIRLQLTTEGLQVARGLFQDSQPDDSLPISHVLNIITGLHNTLNLMCLTRGKATNYSVVVYTCANDYDCAEFVDNYRRLRRGVTVDGDNFDLRPIDDTNWTLGSPRTQEPQTVVYVQKNTRVPIGKGHVIVAPPQAQNHEQSMTLKRGETHNKIVIQNGNGHSQTYSDSGIVTNGTSSTDKSRTKPKRSKSFKLFDSLKGKAKREQSPHRDKKVRNEKNSKTIEIQNGSLSQVNGVQHQPTTVEQELTATELRENLQHVNEELKNIKLMLSTNSSTKEEGEIAATGRIYQKHSPVGDKTAMTSQKHTSYASDSEVRPISRSRKLSNDKALFKSSSVSRTQSNRNGEVMRAFPEYRGPVGYVVSRPVRVAQGGPTEIHHHGHRSRTYSNGVDTRSTNQHGTDGHVGTTHSTSTTLPRSYKTEVTGSPASKHAPRVTFDETAGDTTSRRSSTRSVSRLMHGPRASDTVVKPIEKVYANPNTYYGQHRAVVVGPRQGSGYSQRHSSHDREYIIDDRRNGHQEIQL